ncbi:glycosyltransferase [Arsenicicoccus dermatophilus]|uniref:glycosyltransferase n=1 Tax=Arsenicicoccus dermatophilus TaxID=1076331 RepID=UPI00391702C8
MRILLVAWGSRGDVQPFVALGLGLRAAGHEVTVAATQDFAEWIRGLGLGHAQFPVSVAELVRTDLGRRWLGGASTTTVGELRLMRQVSELSADPLVTTLLAAAPGHDLVVSSTLSFDACWSLARATRVRHAIALFAPVLQSRLGSSYVYAVRPRRRSLVNLVAGSLTATAVHPVVAPVGAELRRRLGLPRPTPWQLAQDIRSTPVLLAASPQVVPPAPDWPMPVTTTGYWRLADEDRPAEERTPDPVLTDFVTAGPPPVYVGFGSMSTAAPEQDSRLVAEAITRAGVRAVVLRGHADLDPAPHLPAQTRDDVLVVDRAPHAWLLPRCAAVVGHGGAGTTAAALHAGVPQLVVPHMGDQPYWGRRVHELGVGPQPVPRRALTADRLAVGIRATGLPHHRRAAAALAATLRLEDGVATAVRLLATGLG